MDLLALYWLFNKSINKLFGEIKKTIMFLKDTMVKTKEQIGLVRNFIGLD